MKGAELRAGELFAQCVLITSDRVMFETDHILKWWMDPRGGCEMIHTIFLLSLTQSSFLQLSRSVLHLHRPMILIVAQVELSTKVICASLTIHAHKHLTYLDCSRPCAGLLRFPRVFTQNRQGKISCFESSWTHRILVLIVGSSVVSSSQCLNSYARAL